MSERANPVDPLLTSELLAHHGFVRALARRLVRDAAAADDVAQDSMARLLEIGRPSSIRPFLRTVVTNVARRFGRRERRRIEVESASAAGPRATAPAAAELAQRLELQRRLTERVLALAPPMRDVVLLHFYEGKTVAETAAELTIPLPGRRARPRLRAAELRERWNGELGGEREGLAAVALLARWTPAKALVTTAAAAVRFSGPECSS
jgi:RNA polymerase sigma-70 factor (ECF subfamily)